MLGTLFQMLACTTSIVQSKASGGSDTGVSRITENSEPSGVLFMGLLSFADEKIIENCFLEIILRLLKGKICMGIGNKVVTNV
jgi:hypothetical protein